MCVFGRIISWSKLTKPNRVKYGTIVVALAKHTKTWTEAETTATEITKIKRFVHIIFSKHTALLRWFSRAVCYKQALSSFLDKVENQ